MSRKITLVTVNLVFTNFVILYGVTSYFELWLLYIGVFLPCQGQAYKMAYFIHYK